MTNAKRILRRVLQGTCASLLLTGAALLSLGAGGATETTSTTKPTPPPAKPPELSLFLTGETNGYLKPCGCVSFQLGGLSRFATHLKEQSKHRPNRLLLSNGQLFEGMGEQNEMEATVIAQVFQYLNYGVVNLTERELCFGAPYLATMFKGISGVSLVSANFRPEELDGMVEPWVRREVTIDGKPAVVGITGVLDPSLHTGAYSEPPSRSPEEALEEVLAAMSGVDLRVLLYMGRFDEAKALAERFPALDVIVTGYDEDKPNDTPERIGNTLVVKTGNKGKYLVVVDVENLRGERSYSYHPIALSQELPEDPTVKGWLTAHRDQIAKSELLERNARLKKLDPNGARYVGSIVCSGCHQDEHTIWSMTRHAKAYKTLKDINEHRNPECIYCHSVGYGVESGYYNEEETPMLVDVGCENCHGPGSLHVASEDKKGYRNANLGKCVDCHHTDHDPNWDPKKWEQIAHGKAINKIMIEKLTKAKEAAPASGSGSGY